MSIHDKADGAARRSMVWQPIAAFGAWAAVTVGLLVLASGGPTLWAKQGGANAHYALAIFAMGQLVALAVLFPIVARHRLVIAVIAVAMPIAVRIAAGIEGAPTLRWIELAAKLDLLIAVFATIWVAIPRWRFDRRLIWVAMLVVAVAWPLAPWLGRDFGPESEAFSHFAPQRLLLSTFLHD